jgi:hypothetical protein
LNKAYRTFIATILEETPDFLGDDYRDIVLEAVQEYSGIALPNFLSHPAFSSLLHTETKKLEAPTQQLIQQVFECYSTVTGLHIPIFPSPPIHLFFFHLLLFIYSYTRLFLTEKLLAEEFNIAPKLLDQLQQSVLQFLENSRKVGLTRILDDLDNEQQDVFTLNPSYMDTIQEIKRKIDEINTPNNKFAVTVYLKNNPH